MEARDKNVKDVIAAGHSVSNKGNLQAEIITSIVSGKPMQKP